MFSWDTYFRKPKNCKVFHNKPGSEFVLCCFWYRSCEVLKQHFHMNPDNQKRLLKYLTLSVSLSSILWEEILQSISYTWEIKSSLKAESVLNYFIVIEPLKFSLLIQSMFKCQLLITFHTNSESQNHKIWNLFSEKKTSLYMDNITVTLILSHICSSVRLKLETTLSLIQKSLTTACLLCQYIHLWQTKNCMKSLSFVVPLLTRKNGLSFLMLLLQMHSS